MSKLCLGCMSQYGDEFNICPHCGYVVGTKAEEAIHMEPGTRIHSRYIVGKVLGFGGFGVTYIAWDERLEQKVAIKEYLPSEFSTRMPGQTQVTVFNGEKSEQYHDGLSKFIDEAKRLAKFQNEPGIVRIFDSFEENSTAYIVMEFLKGETLASYMERVGVLDENDAVAMLMPVMESLQAVHAEGILHRDIAPDNIFLTDDGEIKLIDFGASRYATTSHSRSLTVVIKQGYSPEEQYRSRGDHGPHTDVYSLAATLYRMVTGETPPDAMERRVKYETKRTDVLVNPHKLNKGISKSRENAILNALNVRIEDRTPTIEAFIQELTSPTPPKRIYGKIKLIDRLSWPLWLKILIPSLLVIIVCLGLLLVTGVINFSKFTQEIVIPEGIVVVPEVEGLYKDEALELIEEGQLLASAEGTIESEYIPAGKIILQTPVGGSYMDINGTVELMVSSGKDVVSPENGVSTVPYVIWDSKDDAIAKLLKAGLSEPEIVEKYDDNVALGSVIAQSINAGDEVEEGTKITLTISLGPSAFEMPDVVGDSLESAEAMLTSKGLVVYVEYKKTDNVEEGKIISQSTALGTAVKRGDEITLTVSSGRETIDVANVVGKSESDATSILKGQGFKVTVLENYDSTVAAGKVISQSPKAGTAQLPNSTIIIYVSKGKQPINVSFNANGGSVSNGSNTLYLNEGYGELPTPEREGYSFKGWYSAKSGGVKVTSSTIVTTPSSHTLYAQWTANEYTVSFNTNGGGAAPSSKKVSYGSKYGDLETVSRSGYTFVGWYTSASGGTEILSESKYTTAGNQTLYAHWSEKGYTVTFNANGGSVATSSKNVVYASTYGTLPTPIRSGYIFDGWYTSASGGSNITSSSKVEITSSQTLYAHWTKIVVTEISVRTEPSITDYFVGDTLNASGLSLVAKYNDGTSKTIFNDFTCSPTTLTASGTQTISVSYEGKTTKFTVNVEKVLPAYISVKSNPSKTSYYVGDTLDTSGLTLTETYNNGTTKIVTTGFSCTPTKLSSSGTKSITVTYNGKTTTFSVNVKSVDPISISIQNKPTKTSYYEGDSLNTSGLSLSVKYNNGTTKTITSGFSCSPTTLSSSGTKTITVSYEGFTTTFTVNVEKVEPTSISVNNKPTKTSYYKGETLNTSGLSLTVKCNNGTTKTITSGFSCSPTTLSSSGTKTITVSYEGKTTTFTVYVEDVVVSSISVKSGPTKTSYYEGDTLNTSGLSLTVKYNNGTSKTISSGFSCSPTSLSSSGTKTITVTYEGKTTTFTVSVSKLELSSITVKSKPSKTSYYVGESFNDSGLTLTAKYNNGSTKTISNGFSCSPTGGFSSSGTKTITVSYGGKTTTFTVSVSNDSIVSMSSYSGSFKVLDTGIEITDYSSTVYVGEEVSISVSHSWDRTPKKFTVTTNSSATKVTASSSNTSVVTTSVSQSGNVATITVTPCLIDYNTTKTASVYVYLNGTQKATYSASVYRPHSLSLSSSDNKIIYVKGNVWDGSGVVCAVGTDSTSSTATSSNIAYLTVTTYNGNTAQCRVTVKSPSFTTNTTYNIRSGAGTGYSSLGTVGQGVTLSVYGNYWDGTYIWGYINYNGKWGWIAQFKYSG